MKRWLPTRAELLASRWLRPLAHRLDDDRLWHLDRGSVARAVAIGLFFGLLIPVAQFLFAIGTAIALRGNVAVAAAATLVTNPFTFPPIYWAAYQIGRVLLGRPDSEASALAAEAETEALLSRAGWLDTLWAFVQGTGAPLLVGLATLAVSAAALGFCLVWLLWRRRHAGTDTASADEPAH